MSMDCVLFDFATKNLHLATIFCHLVDKCDLRKLLISSPAQSGLFQRYSSQLKGIEQKLFIDLKTIQLMTDILFCFHMITK